MTRNAVVTVILTSLLTSMLILIFNVPIAKSTGIIRIRPDGSVDPPTAPIHRVEDLYTFTDNIFTSIVVERENIVIDGNGFTVQGAGIGWGLDLSMRNNVTVKNATVRGFDAGIYLNHSDGNTLSSNIICSNKRYGIRFWFSSNNVLSDNILTNNMFALNFGYSFDNVLLGNMLADNYVGIWLCYCSDNLFYGNIFTGNNYGIYNDYSSNNRIHNNNFVHNRYQCGYFDRPYNNVWDNGYFFGGNYWSDYNETDVCSGPYQNDTGSDGIGDTAYIVDENNQDNYPLMGIFSNFNTSLGYHVNVVSNSTIEDFTFCESNSTIKMLVSNTTANQTCGFCRIGIPSALMSEPYNVIIDGAEPHYVNYTLYADGDNRWIHFSYEHSTLEIIIIPEFPSLIILSLFITATLLAVIAYRSEASAYRHKCNSREHRK